MFDIAGVLDQQVVKKKQVVKKSQVVKKKHFQNFRSVTFEATFEWPLLLHLKGISKNGLQGSTITIQSLYAITLRTCAKNFA